MFSELVARRRSKQIASFKLPERLEILESGPAGNILKRELRDIVAQRPHARS